MTKLIRCFLATTFTVAVLLVAGLDTSWRSAHAQDEGLGCAPSGIATGSFCGLACGWRIWWDGKRIRWEDWCYYYRYCRLADAGCGPFPE